jgi:pyruvate dehydrogenase E1 component alpha subunit
MADEDLLDMWKRMVLIRAFEAMVQKLYERGLVHGSTHLYDGQEAVAVGFAAAMLATDYSTYTYRCHGHVLARGMEPEAAFAEILGRKTGVNGGRGGSMHLTDRKLGLMGSFAIVGAGLPVAVGLARAAQLSNTDRVSVTFFGDGAANIGAFHEALNLAAVWRAPTVFVCENNLYGEYSRIDQTTPLADIAERARAYAMPSLIVDGNDVIKVNAVAVQVLRDVRAGGGPVLVECKTYRHRGHSRSDPATYRPRAEVEAWLARDPILIARERLLASGASTDRQLEELAASIGSRIKEAAEAAEAAPWPSAASITENVYA